MNKIEEIRKSHAESYVYDSDGVKQYNAMLKDIAHLLRLHDKMKTMLESSVVCDLPCLCRTNHICRRCEEIAKVKALLKELEA